MAENIVAKVFKGMGIAVIVIGILAFLIIGNETESVAIGAGGVIGSIIFGMTFVGLSEIIDLLQRNVDQQTKIIKKLGGEDKNVVTEGSASSSYDSDDNEFNFPKL